MNPRRSFKRRLKLLLINILASLQYSFIRRPRSGLKPGKIVFVCKGNICRSVFAAYLMRARLSGGGLVIDSCGLNVGVSANGEPPAEAVSAARPFGLDMKGHLSQGVDVCELEQSELILAMEYWQYRKLIQLFPEKKDHIRLLREYAPFPENLLVNIYDPYGHREDVFRECFEQIDRCISRIILQH